MSTNDGNFNCNYYWNDNCNWYVMSNVNGNYFWSDIYSWYNQESGLAPVTVMITIIITKLELNLK